MKKLLFFGLIAALVFGAMYALAGEDWIAVKIDIKPGDNPNEINLGSKGVTPVAVLTADGFDASTVNPANVSFAGAIPVKSALEDVDRDGDIDMILHFNTQELTPEAGSTELTLTGATHDCTSFTGTDSVNIVK